MFWYAGVETGLRVRIHRNDSIGLNIDDDSEGLGDDDTPMINPPDDQIRLILDDDDEGDGDDDQLTQCIDTVVDVPVVLQKQVTSGWEPQSTAVEALGRISSHFLREFARAVLLGNLELLLRGPRIWLSLVRSPGCAAEYKKIGFFGRWRQSKEAIGRIPRIFNVKDAVHFAHGNLDTIPLAGTCEGGGWGAGGGWRFLTR